MVEAAEGMPGITPPYDYDVINSKIDELMEPLRNGEEVESVQAFPAATLEAVIDLS